MNPAPLALAALLGLAACVPIPIIPHRLQFRDDPPQIMTLPANPPAPTRLETRSGLVIAVRPATEALLSDEED